MSSWVAPVVAAEIWGVSVDHVLAGVANGSIPSYIDGQFLFVDLTGQGQMPDSPRPDSNEKVVTEAEIAALTFEPRDAEPIFPDPEDSPVEEESEGGRDVGAWRTARQESARTRRPPAAEAA